MTTIFMISFFYLLMFFLMQSFFVEEQKIKKVKKSGYGIFIILGVALIVRIMMANIIAGFTTDMSCWQSWSDRMVSGGPANFYEEGYFADYPPLYMLVLYFIGLLKNLFGANGAGYIILLKLPSMIADVCLAGLVYFAARPVLGNKQATSLSFVMLVCPAIILNSTFWGQIDSLFSFVLLLSVYMVFTEKYYWGAFVYAVALLIKPQALIVAPLYLCAYLETKDYKMIGKCILTGLCTVVVVALPFTHFFKFEWLKGGFDFVAMVQSLDMSWLIKKYANTLASYPYYTINAYNLYHLFGYNWRPIDQRFLFIPGVVWSNAAILGTVALSVWFYIKSKGRDKLFYMGYLIVATLFTLGSKMHERYIFPGLIFLIFAYICKKDKRLLYLFIAQTTLQFINSGVVLADNIKGTTTGGLAVFIFSLLTVFAYVYSIYIMFKIYIPEIKLPAARPVEKELFKPGKMVKKDYIIVSVLTVLYAISAFAGLGDMKAPQTFYNTENKTFILDIGSVKNVDFIMLYGGIGDSSKHYNIEQSKDGVYWTPYTNQAHPTAFSWNKIKVQAQARCFKITPEKDNMMLGEIGIYSNDGNLIPYATSIKEINDEQNTVPTMPSHMNGTYFDEIYHPRTAYEVLHKIAPYENTHPPLGKLIMGVGVSIFGMTPFGWRFMGTLAGVLMLPVMYAFAKKLFNRTNIAAIGTFLFAVDFMHFSQTRLATIDSFAVLFIMIMYYFLIDYLAFDFNGDPLNKGFKSLALAGIFFGIGAATKWVCIYAALGMAVLLIIAWSRAYMNHLSLKKKTEFPAKFRKTFLWCVLFFVVVPVIIYSASYIPAMTYDLHGRTPLQYIVGNQTYMYNYHSGIKDTHSFSSKWYEWLVIKKPLWAYVNSDLKSEGIASSIASFGNPAVWWIGLVSLILVCLIAVKKKGTVYLLIIIPYLSQLLPWVAVTRIVFIYHYFACVPFMILGILYLMVTLKEKYSISDKVFYCYCGVAFALFVMFYPLLSGMPVPLSYFDYLKWFESWHFI